MMQGLTKYSNGYKEEEVLAALQFRRGSRRLTFRYDLLDSTNAWKGNLTNVLDASVSLNNLADIKRTAKFRVTDDGSINFLSDRIKPWVRLDMPVSRKSYTDILAGITSPLVRYRMDEVTGSVATDSSGNGNNASIPGTGVTKGFPGLRDGGSSFDFTDGGPGITASPAAWIDGNDELTLVAWIQSDQTGVTRSILNGSSISVAYQTTGLVGGAASCIQAQINTDHGNVIACTVAGTQTKATQCIIVTWTAGLGVHIYINGEEAQLSGFTDPLAAAKTSSIFGTFVVGNGWDGRIDEVSAFASACTADQARDIYQAGAKVGAFGSANYVEFPQGVFLLSSPKRNRTEGGTIQRDVDAYDQLQVLTDDKVTDRYTVAAGIQYTEAVRDLMSGIPNKSITNSAITLPVAKEWDPGTSKLSIINDLLSAINYRSLSFDEDGAGIVQPYTSPDDRPSEYSFADDETSVISPEMEQALDVFAVPNKWVLVVSDPDRAPLSSTYTNADPTSLTSTTSRGRTIVDFRTEQDAADQASLDGLVQRLAFEASQVFEEVTFTTGLWPVMGNDDVYDLTYSGLAISAKYSAHTWDMQLEAGSLMKHTARRVVQV